MLEINQIHQGDCLELMQKIPDKSIDAIITDLPYQLTFCKWDKIIPFEPLWKQYKRIIKDNSAIVLTASQPFTSALVMSNIEMFKYEWIWEKAVGSNFATVKYQPMKEHENILVFGNGKIKYNPIMQERKGSGKNRCAYTFNNKVTSKTINNETFYNQDGERKSFNENLRSPSSVQYFNNREASTVNGRRGLHPTQKPIALLEYLIKTYTNEGDLILDNCIGSGSTAIAAINTNRNFIGIEKEIEYCNIANKRIMEVRKNIKSNLRHYFENGI